MVTYDLLIVLFGTDISVCVCLCALTRSCLVYVFAGHVLCWGRRSWGLFAFTGLWQEVPVRVLFCLFEVKVTKQSL